MVWVLTWKDEKIREINFVEMAGTGTIISVNLEAAMSARWITNHYDLNRIYFINLSSSQKYFFFYTSDINISTEWGINLISKLFSRIILAQYYALQIISLFGLLNITTVLGDS